MDTATKPLTQEAADAREVIDHAFHGAPLDPEIANRVHERAEKVREDMRARGVKIDAVKLFRESREEL